MLYPTPASTNLFLCFPAYAIVYSTVLLSRRLSGVLSALSGSIILPRSRPFSYSAVSCAAFDGDLSFSYLDGEVDGALLGCWRRSVAVLERFGYPPPLEVLLFRPPGPPRIAESLGNGSPRDALAKLLKVGHVTTPLGLSLAFLRSIT